jgi:Cu(I)/Ag(I) efflux system membrane fusion protein
MKKALYAVLLLALMSLSFLVGRTYTSRSHSPEATSRRVLYWTDPMHPAYQSDKPGIAPDCGMELVAVYEGEEPAGFGQKKMPVGSVNITPEKQQLIGIKLEEVQSSSPSVAVRVPGRVAADETRIYRLNAAVDGWIRDTYSNSTDSIVEKNQPLASFYAPEFLAAQQALLFAAGAMDRWQATGKETEQQISLTNANIQQAVDSLRVLGMGEAQIAELQRTRQLTQNVIIESPAQGLVLARNISPGQRFEKGTEFYRIADLSRIWILADLFQNEAQYFRPGVMARVTLQGQNRVFMAKVSSIPPRFDPATRTLKVRLEAENPGFILRPDMFVDVELPIALPPGLTVSADALIDSGLHKRVFVDRGNGAFEPREVEVGWRRGDRVQVVKGLSAGERVVVSATFMVDSESRLRAAAGIYSHAAKDPVCGMEVDQQKSIASGKVSEYKGVSYYFCSEQCKHQFEAAPARYLTSSHEENERVPELKRTTTMQSKLPYALAH